ncbi:MAG TPA: hypothetical protein DCG57_06470, partial [Candidatus Riflebacteria bacterium]|nr:hypothetical protein [Candidatus Riflebacteria bacterium]
MHRLFIFILLALSVPVCAENTEIAELRKQIEQLTRSVQQLNQRVETLEMEKAILSEMAAMPATPPSA